MFQDSEVVNLIMGVVSLFVFLVLSRNNGLPQHPAIYTGFFFILAGYFFTVIEGVFWHDLFNVLEHFSYAVAAVLFAAGAGALARRPDPGRGGP